MQAGVLARRWAKVRVRRRERTWTLDAGTALGLEAGMAGSMGAGAAMGLVFFMRRPVAQE